MEKLYENDRFEFVLTSKDEGGASGARIVRTDKEEGAETVLFDYSWSEQLTVEVAAENAVLREDGVLCWQLHVTAHHVKGVIQGEFTETEWFELENPFGSADEMVCRTGGHCAQDAFCDRGEALEASAASDISACRRKAGAVRASVGGRRAI